MVNINRLAGKIRENRLTQKLIARRLDLSEQSLSRKMRGKARFYVDEVEQMARMLSLTKDEMLEIFFNNDAL
jgi:transcriptional regulator with XRE-family HTH domain